MSYIEYNGIPCKCAECYAKVSEGNAHMHVLWANQHGAKIRIFCDMCGDWSDWVKTSKSGLCVTVFTPTIHHPSYVDKVFEKR